MRRIYPTGYSAVGKSQAQFRAICEALARDLPEVMNQCEADAIAVRGSSGLSVAFGIRMLADIPFIVCRKGGEQSHSDQISMAYGSSLEVGAYLILDDLISSGKTVEGIVRDLGTDTECTGIVTYDTFDPSYRMMRKGELRLASGQSFARYTYSF